MSEPRHGGAEPAGWRPDPWFDGQQRWWDGATWTADTFPDGPVAARAAPAPRPSGGRPAARAPTTYAATLPPPPDWQRHAAAAEELTSAEAVDGGELAGGPPRRRIPKAAVNAGALVVGLAVGFGVVWALTDDGPGPSAAPPVQAAPALTPPAPPAALALLQGLVVRQQDVPAGHIVSLLPDGTNATTEPTLDLCNGTYPSESLRTARLQVSDLAPTGSVTLSTEAVRYRSAEATAQAFRELGSVSAACPDRPVVSPVGEPTVTTTLQPNADEGWPAVEGVSRLAYHVTTDDGSGSVYTSVAVYLRRGAVLEGVYFPSTGAADLSVDGQRTMRDVVHVFEKRLAALPASEVGG